MASGCFLKGNQGLRQGFPNWLKLSHTMQQGLNTPITNYRFLYVQQKEIGGPFKIELVHQKLDNVLMPPFHFLFLLDLDPQLIIQINC